MADIMARQEALYGEHKGMVAEFDALYEDAVSVIMGTAYERVAQRRKRLGRTSSEWEVQGRAYWLRRDKTYKQQINRVLERLMGQARKKVYRLQTKSYRDALAAVAGAWNEHTVRGVAFKVKVTRREADRLHGQLLSGLTVREWLADIEDQLRRDVLAASTVHIASPTGETDGKRLLAKRIRNAVAKAAKRISAVAQEALNQANAAAFEEEQRLFAEQEAWAWQ